MKHYLKNMIGNRNSECKTIGTIRNLDNEKDVLLYKYSVVEGIWNIFFKKRCSPIRFVEGRIQSAVFGRIQTLFLLYKTTKTWCFIYKGANQFIYKGFA
jgi:hypothetical protein